MRESGGWRGACRELPSPSFPDARHEILSERDEIRQQFLAAFDSFITTAASAPELLEGEVDAHQHGARIVLDFLGQFVGGDPVRVIEPGHPVIGLLDLLGRCLLADLQDGMGIEVPPSPAWRASRSSWSAFGISMERTARMADLAMNCCSPPAVRTSRNRSGAFERIAQLVGQRHPDGDGHHRVVRQGHGDQRAVNPVPRLIHPLPPS